MSFVPTILIGVATIFVIIYLINPANFNLESPLKIYGVRLRVSLEEIYNKIIPSKKINLLAILDGRKNVIWSDTTQIHLTNNYSDISEYILLLREPMIVSPDEEILYEKQVTQRFEYILQRDNVFISFTDNTGTSISLLAIVSIKTISIIAIVFVLLAVILYGYFKLTGKH
jgi:hypothetical protein